MRFAGDEAPLDGSAALLLGNRQYRVEGAAHGTRHVFGADYGPVVFLQPVHLTLEVLGPSVVVKRDDVGFAKLNLIVADRIFIADVMERERVGDRWLAVVKQRDVSKFWDGWEALHRVLLEAARSDLKLKD